MRAFKKETGGGLVYSTDAGRMCPACEQPVDTCRCVKKAIPRGDGVVRIQRSTSGRKGKGVTVLSGFDLDAGALEELGKDLRRLCGTGGTVKNGTIEIQGDQRERLSSELVGRGFTVKLVGG